MHDMSMAVGDDLKLNVVRIKDELFYINLIISKRFLCFMPCAVKGRFKTGLIMRSTHPAAAATGSRLDHYRIAKFPCNLDRLIFCLDDSIASGRHGYAGFARSGTSSVLVAHCLHRTRGRPDEPDVAALAHFDEMRVLGEKSIAGMNRVNIADLGCAHDPIDSQITFQARGGADADRFVSKLDVQRIDVCLRINRQSANAEFFARANHPQRDFSAISNQYFLKHWDARFGALGSSALPCLV